MKVNNLRKPEYTTSKQMYLARVNWGRLPNWAVVDLQFCTIGLHTYQISTNKQPIHY